MTIRVAVADDHPTMLAGMEYLLSTMPDVAVVGLVADSTGLVELLGSTGCDVVITDFSMPGGRYGDGISLIGFLRRRFPMLRLVVLTGLENPTVLQSILAVGVEVLVGKLDEPEQTREAILAAFESRPYLSPGIRRIVEGMPAPGIDGSLSKRETEVVRLLAEGLSVSEIGERIGRSRKTISAQKVAAMKKLGLQGDADLFRYALANGLIHASQGPRAVTDPD